MRSRSTETFFSCDFKSEFLADPRCAYCDVRHMCHTRMPLLTRERIPYSFSRFPQNAQAQKTDNPFNLLYLVSQSLGGGGAPRGYPCGGEMESPSPPRAPIFEYFLRYFSLVFMGIRRTCGHAITPCDILSALLTVPCCSTDRLHSSRP